MLKMPCSQKRSLVTDTLLCLLRRRMPKMPRKQQGWLTDKLYMSPKENDSDRARNTRIQDRSVFIISEVGHASMVVE